MGEAEAGRDDCLKLEVAVRANRSVGDGRGASYFKMSRFQDMVVDDKTLIFGLPPFDSCLEFVLL